MLYDGSAKDGLISLSFMNRGKVPIEELDFYCSPPAKTESHGASCHVEDGLFYPGHSYSIKFAYGAGNRAPVAVGLRRARLAQGLIWTSQSSEPCHTVRIHKKK